MLALRVLAVGDPDSGGGSDLAVEAAGTVGEDEAEMVAGARLVVDAGLHRAGAAVEEELVAVRAGCDELVGLECLESVAEIYFSVDDTFFAVGGGHVGMGVLRLIALDLELTVFQEVDILQTLVLLCS